MVHCDVNCHLGFEFSAQWLRVQAVWIMCQVFLMVAHNFTDQWALSIAVRKKKVEFVMGPNSIFYTHCSARTRPFESCCAAKYHLWNNPLVWYSIWIEILLRLISDTLSVLNTEAELPRGQLCPGARNPGAQERKLTNQPTMHITETQSTESRWNIRSTGLLQHFGK